MLGAAGALVAVCLAWERLRDAIAGVGVWSSSLGLL